MKLEEEIEFPCGLRSYRKIVSGMFDFYTLKSNSKPEECPLHGKKCKK